MTKNSQVRELMRALRVREKEMVELLRDFVECESPSSDKAAVDRFGEMVAAEWQKRGATVEILGQSERGNHVRAEIAPEGARGQVLILGHLDTVYPIGTLAKMPFRVVGGKAFGPGTFDMKCGLVQALFAVDALRELAGANQSSTSGASAKRLADAEAAKAPHQTESRMPEPKLRPPNPALAEASAAATTGRGGNLAKRLVFFWDSDEEIGSHTSRKLIEAEARRSDAVLVLEPGLGPRGDLKTERKGVGTAEVIVSGRAAHAGIAPGTGVNAVHELALQIERLMKMNDYKRGITVQATVISGGTASNVVPAQARAQVDVRCARLADAAGVNRRLHAMRPILEGAKIEVRGWINRPPLERTAGVVKLFRHAQALGREMGIKLAECATGGGSDGNFTAALGVPTLDGLGAVGDGAHALNEHVVVRAIPVRAALLAGLLATV